MVKCLSIADVSCGGDQGLLIYQIKAWWATSLRSFSVFQLQNSILWVHLNGGISAGFHFVDSDKASDTKLCLNG